MTQRYQKSLAGVWLLSPLLMVANVNADPLALNPASPWYGTDLEAGWHYDVGIGIEYEPGYAGSDKYAVEGDVDGRALYRTESGSRLFINLGEIGGAFSLSPNTEIIAFFEYEEGREIEDDATLTGLNPVDSTVEGQFMLARRFGNTMLFGGLQADLTGDANKGLVWFLGGGYDWLAPDKRWRANTTFDLSGADGEYMRTEFGITPEETSRTGYTTYQPSSGLKSVTWNIAVEYYFSDRLSLLSGIETEYYLTEASDSPLISDEGSDVTFEATMLLRYQF